MIAFLSSRTAGNGSALHAETIKSASSVRLPTKLIVELPLRIESVANRREHWSVRARRAKAHRMASLAVPNTATLPALVTLTRIAPRLMDDDNNVSGFKALRDGIAARYGVDDGSQWIVWNYKQERGKPKQYGVRVEIESIA